MQRKTIEKVIKAKMEEWIETLPELLGKAVKKSLLVSGGSIASMFLGEDVNDYDVYIQDRNVLLDLVRYYTKNHELDILDGAKKSDYLDHPFYEVEDDDITDTWYQWQRAVRNLKDNQVRIFVRNLGEGLKVEPDKDKTYQPAFFSANAISLTNEVQIVNRFHGTPDEIHATFDFIHATNYFTFDKGLVTNLAAVESLLTKQLKYQGSFYPLTSIIRMKKFINRKWNINAGEILKIMFQISELNLKDVDVLEEQLIGVDVAYFGALIRALQNTKQEITSTYLGVLIDKIFNDDSQD